MIFSYCAAIICLSPLRNFATVMRMPAAARIGVPRGESALTPEDGDSDELRSGSSETEEGLGGESTLEGYSPSLQRRGRRSAARVAPHRAHARAARRGEALEARHRGAVRERPWRDDGQPGDATGQGGT